jgi:hypothetical protein
MHHIALDTNTWIYLANGTEPSKLLRFIEEESEKGNVKVLVPKIVIDEWNRNKDHAVKQGALKHFRDVVEAMDRILKLLGNKGEKDILGFLLEDKNQDYFKDFIEKFKEQRKEVEDAITENIDTIDHLFKDQKIQVIEISDAIMLKCGNYALNKKAPFIKKNSFADALIVFSFLDYVLTQNIEGAMFITYNTEDFCEKKDAKKLLHPDLMPEFEKSKSKFYHIVGEALATIKKDIITKEELQLIKELQEEQEDNSERCLVCEEDDRYSMVYFKEVDLYDERAPEPKKQITNQLPLPNLAVKKEVVIPEAKFYTGLLVGDCDYCASEHFICVECTSLNVIYDHEYGEEKQCDGCDLIYVFEREVDRKGMHWGTTYKIPKRTKTCRSCGEEYDQDKYFSKDDTCETCENKVMED